MTTQQAKDEGTAIEGIDIIVDGGTPEFEICKLYDSVDKVFIRHRLYAC